MPLNNRELEMFVVYDHPKDFPENFVVRRFVIAADVATPTGTFYLGDSLEEVRGHLPPYCARLERDPNDDACIVESWL